MQAKWLTASAVGLCKVGPQHQGSKGGMKAMVGYGQWVGTGRFSIQTIDGMAKICGRSVGQGHG